MNELIKKLGLPNLSQIGIVVENLTKTIDYYESVMGLGPFVIPDITYDKIRYYDKEVDSKWLMGLCSLGNIELELIQPLYGPTIYTDFIKQKGEGLHHLGFIVDDIDEKLRICDNMGIEITQYGEGVTSIFAYLDTLQAGGTIFELIHRKKKYF